MVGRIFEKNAAARHKDCAPVPPAASPGEFPSFMSTGKSSLGWPAERGERMRAVPGAPDEPPSVSTSAVRNHHAAALLYVVSRSGKVLRSEERPAAFVEDEYLEGELEGWIFLGKGGGGGRIRNGDGGRGSSGEQGRSWDSLGLVSWTKKVPFVVWGDEPESLQDVLTSVPWRQISRVRASRRISAEPWADANGVFGESLAASFDPRQVFRSEIWYRIERNYKIGLSQLAFLQQSDLGQKLEPGLREVAARWAAWLLKMLRRTQSRPLQHLLFTMCSAVLPVISCSLARQPWNRVSDQELCNCVDIVSCALERSYTCFTPTQWGILKEKLAKCRWLRTQVGVLGDDWQGAVVSEKSEDSACGTPSQLQLQSLNLRPPAQIFQEPNQPWCNSKANVQLSYFMVQRDGVSSLLERALCEKLFTPRSRKVTRKEAAGVLVSLVCPLSGGRIKIPSRGRGCTHPSSFDLQAFLEEQARNVERKSDSFHQQKKPKRARGAWCCPICGSDATWPQLIVDRTLLRILKVLPEDMRQVFLLPSGRWHSLWGQIGEDLGNIDSRLTRVAIRVPFTSALHHEGNDLRLLYSLSQSHHQGREEAAFAFHELQILCRAYQTWNGGVDHGERGTTDRIAFQWGPKSTLAILTGNDTGPVPAPRFSNLLEARSNTETEGTGSVSKADAEHLLSDDSTKIREIGIEEGEPEPHAREDEYQIVPKAKLCGGPQAIGGRSSALSLTGGTHGLARMGRHRARPKMMTMRN